MLAGRRLQAARRAAAAAASPVDWRSLQLSRRKGKRFSVRTPSGRTVHFGFWSEVPTWLASVKRRTGRGTYIDHQSPQVRAAWRARHGRIVNAAGRLSRLDPESPEYYAWHVLW